jgi:uncharacterized protein YegL
VRKLLSTQRQLVPIAPQPIRQLLARGQGEPAFSMTVYRDRPTEPMKLFLMNFDTSESMYSSGAIRELKKETPRLITDLQRDPTIRARVLATFGIFADADSSRLTGPFRPVMELTPPEFNRTNGTPLLGRIINSIQLLKARKTLLGNALQVDLQHAWLIECTDGQPTDHGLLAEAMRHIREIAPEHGIEVFLFGVGRDADMNLLSSLAQSGRPAERLLNIKDLAALLKWVSSSLSLVSQGPVGMQTRIRSPNGGYFITE